MPQGSILGPLLFIIYITDLGEYLTECKINLYADDMALYTGAHSYIELMLNLRLEMSVVTEWLKANKLTLNVQKSKYVIFGTRAKLQGTRDINLDISGQPLERTTKMKYLGMILDDRLTFDDHIDYICNKAVKKLGILRKAQNFLDLDTSVLLYKSLVLPQFDYCDTVYSCTSAANLH